MSDVVGITREGEQVLTAARAPMAVLDEERHVAANREYAELYGFEGRADVEGTAWRDRFDEEARPRLDREALPECRETGEWRGEVTGRLRDGRTVALELTLTRLDHGRYVSCLRPLEPDRRSDDGTTDHYRRLETIVETVDDGIYVLDEDLALDFVNGAFCELVGRSREELQGSSVMDLFSYDDERALAEDIRQRVVQGDTSTGTVQATMPTAHGERTLEARYRLYPEPDGAYRGSIGIVRDVTEREERERRLEHQRDELETLDGVNELVLEITRDLFDSASRRGIEETVCEVLASSDLYRFAWIGGPEPGGDRLAPRVVAGIDEAAVESLLAAPGEDSDAGAGPAVRTFRTGEAVVSQDVPADAEFESWHPVAADQDVRSAAVLPLATGDTTYGCLAVAASRPLAFSRRERECLDTLGRAVGFAFDAIENRKLLYADTVVELEFEVSDENLVFVAASGRLDCELTITGCVESQDGAWSVFVSVAEATPATVRDAVLDDPAVESVQVVAERDDSGLLEFVMSGPALDEIAASGAMLTSGCAARGRGRFCIEAPRTTDVRRLRDRLQAAYPDSTLVAQREYERPVRTAMEIRQSLEQRLTDRQREALERATHAGYFEWPRTSTAGDVAESMAVSETTFHYHLRNGLDTLLGALTDLDGR